MTSHHHFLLDITVGSHNITLKSIIKPNQISLIDSINSICRCNVLYLLEGNSKSSDSIIVRATLKSREHCLIDLVFKIIQDLHYMKSMRQIFQATSLAQ